MGINRVDHYFLHLRSIPQKSTVRQSRHQNNFCLTLSVSPGAHLQLVHFVLLLAALQWPNQAMPWSTAFHSRGSYGRYFGVCLCPNTTAMLQHSLVSSRFYADAGLHQSPESLNWYSIISGTWVYCFLGAEVVSLVWVSKYSHLGRM